MMGDSADEPEEPTPVEEPIEPEPQPEPEPEPEPEPIEIEFEPVTTDNSRPVISGFVGEAEASVNVEVNDEVYVASVNQNGEWVVRIEDDLAPGRYDVRVQAEYEDQREEQLFTNALTVAEPEPEPEPEHDDHDEPEEIPQTGPEELPAAGPRDTR